MSTLVYGALTRKREESEPGSSAQKQCPGVRTYVDALAALVPAEVLAAHTAILTFTTGSRREPDGTSTSTITDASTLKWMFWALLGLSAFLYAMGHYRRNWDLWDWVRVLIPPSAFVVWTMAQKATAFDAVAPGWNINARYGIAFLSAIVLGAVATALGSKADQKTTAARPTRSRRRSRRPSPRLSQGA